MVIFRFASFCPIGTRGGSQITKVSVVIYEHFPHDLKRMLQHAIIILPQDGQHPQRQHEAAQAGPAAPAHRGETATEEVRRGRVSSTETFQCCSRVKVNL